MVKEKMPLFHISDRAPCFSGCSVNPREETKAFLGIQPEEQISTTRKAEVLARVTAPFPITNSMNLKDLSNFNWNGGGLGEWLEDRELAIAKGIRYEPYERIEPLWFASATLSIPTKSAVEAAYIVAEEMTNLVNRKEEGLVELEDLVAGVSLKAYKELCQMYKLSHENTEILFDDNATLALGQFLAMTTTQVGDGIVLVKDTGRVMEDILEGQSPEKLVYNFKPSINVWQNSNIHGEGDHIGPFTPITLEHFSEDKYKSDNDFIGDIITTTRKQQPKVFIIPTVTRSGRIIPFKEISLQIRKISQEQVRRGNKYDPLIILDDAQGLVRINPSEYDNIWDYVDGIMVTGAKVVGSLSGSGAMLINKDRFKMFEIPFEDSSLKYRSRKYSFISSDLNRVKRYNDLAANISNTPEIASLSTAIQEVEFFSSINEEAVKTHHYIEDRLKKIPGVKILHNGGARYVNSIVSFYIEGHEKEASKIKTFLAKTNNSKPPFDGYPITIPSIITTESIDYLRISLDPKKIMSQDYGKFIDYALDRISDAVNSLEQN